MTINEILGATMLGAGAIATVVTAKRFFSKPKLEKLQNELEKVILEAKQLKQNKDGLYDPNKINKLRKKQLELEAEIDKELNNNQ